MRACLFVAALLNFVVCELVRVPGGRSFLRECITQIPSGTTIHNKRSYSILEYPSGRREVSQVDPECIQFRLASNGVPKNEDFNPWKGYTTLRDYQKNISSFVSTLVVPQTPGTTTGDVIYIFPGLQNVDFHPSPGHDPPIPWNLIQPVLQYNYDGSDTWSFSIWYVGTDEIKVTEYIEGVKPTDIVSSTISTCVNRSQYQHQTHVRSTVAGKTLTLDCHDNFMDPQQYAYTVVEQWGGEGSCDSFPRSELLFKDMKIYSNDKEMTEGKWTTTKHSTCITDITVDGFQSTKFTFQKHEE